jgi:hypothetical protein
MENLIPTPTPNRPLTKAQESFRTLLAKVESLRAAIDADEQEFDATLSFYATEIVPRVARQTAVQKKLVRVLAPYLNKTHFPHRQERLEFRDLTRELLQGIANAEKGLIDADLREIYNVVHGVGYAQNEQKLLAVAKAALAKMFAEAGLEADFSELESAVSEADFMARAEAMIARVRKMKEAEAEAARCAEHGRHQTDYEHERAAEELRKRSIANIYKQLARVLHPDLERDVESQKQKVGLMQELTAAYRENDLQTLLRLEMQWIEKERSDVERLSEEKLGVYNDVLRGQVEGLEKRLRDLVFHPRYRPIVVFNHGLTRAMNGPDRAQELDRSIAAIESGIALMQAAKSADDVCAAIRTFRPGDKGSDPSSPASKRRSHESK